MENKHSLPPTASFHCSYEQYELFVEVEEEPHECLRNTYFAKNLDTEKVIIVDYSPFGLFSRDSFIKMCLMKFPTRSFCNQIGPLNEQDINDAFDNYGDYLVRQRIKQQGS